MGGRSVLGTRAARDLELQRVEALVPEAPVWGKPAVDLLQRGGINGVQTPGAGRAHRREAVLAQHAQVL
jgi:hypothetical protein